MVLFNRPRVMCRVFLASAILLAAGLPLAARQVNDRLPVPDADSQAESLELFREVYEAELDQAKTPPQKVALAKKLIEQALATNQDPVGRYILFRSAVSLALLAGDTATAFQAVDETAKLYQTDGVETKGEILATMAKSAKTKGQNQALAASVLEVIDEALANDHYDLAERLVEMAKTAARKARDGTLVRHIAAQGEEIEAAAEVYRAVKDVLAVLDRRPTDPQANLLAGKYYCFRKRDWEKGAPMLALGDDRTLKRLAVIELKEVSSPTEMVELADGWLEASETEENPAKRALQARAIHWYERALPRLSGLTKSKVEKQIQELRRMIIPSGKDVVNLHLVAVIDGSDTLEVFGSHLKWTHHRWDWPKSMAVNGIPWSPRQMPVLPYVRAFGAALPRVDFTSAELDRIRGRSRVLLEKSIDHLVVKFYDGSAGADTYEIVVTMKRLTR